MKKIKELLFPVYFEKFSVAKKIAIIGVVVALNVVTSFVKIPVSPTTQFSIKIAFASLTGFVVGPLYGFSTCFLADFVGWLVKPNGIYCFWIGISSGIMSVIASFTLRNIKSKLNFLLKYIILCLLILVVCTVLINTTGLYIYYNYNSAMPYFEYVVYRLFIEGQIFNSIFNYVLIYITVPVVDKLLIKKYFNVK